MGEFTSYIVKSSYILPFYKLEDDAIYKKAREQGNVNLISKDADFSELINRLGSPPKLIYLKTGNCDNKKLWNFLKGHIKEAIEILVSTDVTVVEME